MSFWGSLVHLYCIKMAGNSKAPDHIEIWIEFGTRGVLVEHTWGPFDLVLFKVI